jgi:N-acylneuraminate cytidylyltransferase
MSTDACIFARSGSKGIPNKNIQNFNGKPLMTWAIDVALRVKQIDRVFVSTDSEEIAEIAESAGAIVPFLRPSELATDASPEWLSWQHFIKFLEATDGKLPNVFLSLPATSPLRTVADVENCIKEFKKGFADFVIGITPSERSPYFNMVKVDSDRTVSLAIASETKPFRRQDAPILHDITTIAYSANPNYILKTDSLLSGKVCASFIDRDRAVDIDTEMDFEFAELLFLRGNQANE